MKIRSGFVSNSSSSSYICDVCGQAEGGFDVCLEDIRMIVCAHGHTLCDDHASNLEAYFEWHEQSAKEEQKLLEAEGKTSYYYPSEARDDVPSDHCPLCNLESLSDSDEVSYYRMRFGLSKNEVLEDIVETYGTFDVFMKAVVESRRR